MKALGFLLYKTQPISARVSSKSFVVLRLLEKGAATLMHSSDIFVFQSSLIALEQNREGEINFSNCIIYAQKSLNCYVIAI